MSHKTSKSNREWFYDRKPKTLTSESDGFFFSEADVLSALEAKDAERQKAVEKAYKKGAQSFLKNIIKWDKDYGKRVSYVVYDEVRDVDWDKLAEINQQ